MRIFDSGFFFSRVRDPARSAVLADRIAQRLALADSSHDFARWMRLFSDCLHRALPPGGDAPVDDALAEFVRYVANSSSQWNVRAPVMLSRFWDRERNHRGVENHVLRGWLDEANTTGEFDREWMIDAIDERGDRDVCESCGDQFFIDELERTYNDNYVCESCREDHYTFSSRYDVYVQNDDIRDALDQRGRRCLIHCDDEAFHYDEEADEWMHEDYEGPSRSVIREYHASKHHQRPIEDAWAIAHNRYFGVELEVEVVGDRSRDDCAGAIHERTNGGVMGSKFFFERDGSLANGFEVISQPMSLPAIRAAFEFLREPELVAGLRSHRTSTCGLHVHVSRTGLSNLTIARAVTFVNDPGNDAFVTALARRYNTGFCRYVEKTIETAHLPGDRYEAVNLTGSKTIEFRIFRGSLKFEAVIAAVEFCHALLQFCAREATGASSLNARSFLAFCARSMPDETAVMREYVSQRTNGVFNHSEAA